MSYSYRHACLLLCLLLAGCSDQVARVSLYPAGCRVWTFEAGVTFTEEKTEGSIKCIVEYRRAK